MKQQIRMAGVSVLALAAALPALRPAPALAGPKGRLETTIGLGAASAAAFATHHKEAGVVLAAGTAAAYMSYRQAAAEHQRHLRTARAAQSARVAGYRASTAAAHRPVSSLTP